jgi:hypothetical protein
LMNDTGTLEAFRKSAWADGQNKSVGGDVRDYRMGERKQPVVAASPLCHCTRW